ncbi:RNA polymerase sigma factor [Salinispora cortesiana]|uniref:RNA polymerase sigma factor n=1 Tax=Salinispora cortesiana TaxID=1305843 RepID=UPI0004129DB8|nr:sigma-70 family RNA polymerase sigma factor [Salinispora cortesiana]
MTLFREHSRAVYNHCFRIVGDWSVAEDCVSLVFLEAWRLRDKVDVHGGSLLPWLLGIAVHVVHRRHRVARRHQGVLDRLPPPETVPDFADELVGRLEDAERIAAVREVVRRLPQADQDVLALCAWAGLDYAAAAEALGVPVGTVRSRLSRARRRLEKLAEKRRREREPERESWQVSVGRRPADRLEGEIR